MNRKEAETHTRHGGLVAAMGGSYALGTFADNFFKQCLVLLAAYVGAEGAHSLSVQAGANGENLAIIVQSVATVLYSLPFVVCSAWAGWLADRHIKRNIILLAKCTEFFSLFVGAYAVITGWWVGMLLVVFFMGLQSTFFSPALNGTIPELFSVSVVPRVNSYIKLASTVAILLGIGSAGYIIDLTAPTSWDFDYSYGRVMSGVFIVCVSLLGVLVSLGIKKHPLTHKADDEPFPWAGPWRSFQNFWAYRKEPELFLVFWAEAVFYAVSVIIVICIVNFSKDLGYSPRVSSLLAACIMVGIAVGAIIAGRFDVYSWRRFAVPAGLGMGLMIAVTSLVPLVSAEPFMGLADARLSLFYTLVFLSGICGGIYLIPIASFIQAYPPANEKGKALGVSNFFSYVAMTASAPVFFLLGLSGSTAFIFLVYGLFTMAFALFVLVPGIKRYSGVTLHHRGNCVLGELLKALLSLRYRIREKGLNEITIEANDKRPFLFLPNHTALIDPVIIYSRIMDIRPRVLVDSSRITGPARALRWLCRLIEIDNIAKDGCRGVNSVKRGLDEVVSALERGESVVVYPSGRLSLDGHEWIGGNSAVEHIVKTVPQVRIILVRHTGLWGSVFSLASGRVTHLVGKALKMVPKLVMNGVFFMPKRRVKLEFVEALEFPRQGNRREMNAYLEAFYEENYQEASVVPYYFWQGSTPIWCNRAIKEEIAESQLRPLTIDEATRTYIVSVLAEKAKFTGAVEDSMQLGRDLGLDSLDIMELSYRFETEFGCRVDRLEAIVTVEDLLGAITGFRGDKQTRNIIPSRRWFSPGAFAEAERFVAVPSGKNLVEAFIEHVRSKGSLPFIAEGATMLSRAEVLGRALLLKDEFRKIPHDKVGVLLPSSIASVTTWLALQLAGKTPVYLNWTFGERNVRASIERAGITHIVTSQEFCDRIIYKYGDIARLSMRFLNVNSILGAAGLFRRMNAFIKTKALQYGGYGSDNLGRDVPSTAVILFTSGSEAMPKGVPLSHENLITNIEDIRKTLALKQRIRILAVLPHYHSFGFLLGVAMPCGLGLACVCHPNQRETFTIAELCKAYCPNFVGATPSFLESLLTYGPEYLYSLEHAFVGGEKCHAQLFETFSATCAQGVLCQGYGVTEGSPVISINPPEATKFGSIGKPLQSVITAVVTLDEPFKRVSIETSGQLLVRGPSVFAGYLEATSNQDAFVDFEGERWFKTDDMVKVDAEGYLFYLGRLARFVKKGGEMISLPLIEEILSEGLAKRFGSPLGTKGAVSLVVLAEEGADGTEKLVAVTSFDVEVETLHEILLASDLSAVYGIERVVKLEAFPMLGSGKIDFLTLRDLVAER